LSGDIDHALFEDESTIRDYQAIMKSWFSKGEQRIIKTYGKHEGVKLAGVLNYETGRVSIDEMDKWDAEVFVGFLEKTPAWYPKGRILFVLDNSKVHHAILVEAFLKANPRLTLMFLPPYSPNLNIIEGLWGWLKDTCVNNVFYAKLYQIRLAIRKFVALIDSDRNTVIDRLCVQI
jgi:putative transposase